jgi:hypothetical protein
MNVVEGLRTRAARCVWTTCWTGESWTSARAAGQQRKTRRKVVDISIP